MNTDLVNDHTLAAPPSALTRCAQAAWQTVRRVGVLCWAIGVALMNLGD